MTPTDTYLGLRAFIDELVRCGTQWACTSPGSRSTPMVLSFARDSRINTTSHLDERCSSFFGVGIGKSTGKPAALVCTSGTAAANFYPAVIEAWEARVPLLVLTTDRPPELRDIGAGQTIDQVKMYGSAVKWYLEVDEFPATEQRMRWLRQLACRAFWTATTGRPGPVHLNFSFREPLILDQPLPAEEPGGGGRTDGRPWILNTGQASQSNDDVERLKAAITAAQRPLLVVGRYERDLELGAAAASLALKNSIPLLAEPISNSRRGAAAVAHYDALLRDSGWAAAHKPDLVIRVGDLPTSKPLRLWLNGMPEVDQVMVDPESAWHDPGAVVATQLSCAPVALLKALDGKTIEASHSRESYLQSWLRSDAVTAKAIDGALDEGDAPSEPWIAATLGRELPADATLLVASSMPIRDVETFFDVRSEGPRVLSNRGANGIDGTVSTAFGLAASSDGPVVLLIGDVALAHDISGLIAAKRLDLNLTIVLINNDGGGIFHFLPVAKEGEDFVDYVVTPHGLDFALAAEFYGCEYVVANEKSGFTRALDRAIQTERTTVIEVQTNREENLRLHRGIWDRVAAATRADRARLAGSSSADADADRAVLA